MAGQYHILGIFETMEYETLIFDSGGTKTSFAAVNANWIREGASLHPRNLDKLSREELDFWQQVFAANPHARVIFYGAGCGSELNQQKLRTFLVNMGAGEVEVHPDTLGACRALFGMRPGVAAILGTGSVCMIYDGERITERLGGFGPLVGDEGSGFYFGRLLVQKLLTAPKLLDPQLVACYPTIRLMQELAGPNAHHWIAQLAAETRSYDLQVLHTANFREFCARYLPGEVVSKRQIGLVGSYGCAQKMLFEQVCQEYGWELIAALEKPIAQLLDYHRQK